jgi:alpha-L-rhamnosidase
MRDYAETLMEKDIKQGNKNLILEGFTFGDWLAQDGVCPQSLFGGTDNGFIRSVYYYRSIELTSFAARELGKNDDFEKYDNLKKKIYNAILNEYFAPNGKLALDTQTAYVLSLFYKIYRNKERVLKDFKERIKKDFYRIKTGFTGTPLILLCLFDNDMDDYAYRILFNEECPGWIYAIKLGATTIWERWNSLLADGTISGINMNSFNHYSYGSVCEAIFSRIGGLRNLSPGWKKVLIKPQVNYRLKNVKFTFDSISGKFEICWKCKDNKFYLDVVIPNGVVAEIFLPDKKSFNATGGKYNYECELDSKILIPFSIDTPLVDIINNKEAIQIVKETLPQVYEMATGENDEFKIENIRHLSSLMMFVETKEKVQKCDEELSKIRL